MHRVDRSYLNTCIHVAIQTMRAGKNGKAKHPFPELRDEYNVSRLTSLILQVVDNSSSFVCRVGPAPTDPSYGPNCASAKFGVDEPWPEGCEPK